ncbi:uncharacterized protein BCR38DRAFT_443412 [Pseudomassariella vexata]|uniref:Uncharacterized protein n=1 Tax=Pseudomassariella vexata TaxID=1141098 RepID=A0A1Y2DL27_9PEZI|nr:uncharacterized protein BCR38DRAFT_443412 [Pseudomassariella vexata]ORY59942.1 hypothetical protein BCR38DRAFT_443412 [Pseudomassariella vexata]
MTRTMHWDNRNMLQIMELSKLDAEYQHITNEGVAKEFIRKIGRIADLWAQGCPSWTWPQIEHYDQFIAIKNGLNRAASVRRGGVKVANVKENAIVVATMETRVLLKLYYKCCGI